MADLLQQFNELLGKGGVVASDAIAQRASSYWDASPMQGKVLLRPSSTEQVSRILRLCHAAKQTVVVQGGLTGPVEGAASSADDVIVSLERMTAIESVDDADSVAVIQAGAVLQTVQETLAQRNYLFPLDLGARGSCTIGGAVATNAGGTNVLRYGMMRNQVLGLEAVLADGTVISSMNQMLKNNTGYDVKQLFIGSEGTLGIVTRVVVKLQPLPKSRQTALVALHDFDAVKALLKMMQSGLAGTLSAFEVMWNSYYRAVTVSGAHRSPINRDYPFYALVEAEGVEPDADAKRFEGLLEQALADELVVDAVLPKSESERQLIWQIREDFESLLPAYLYDVSLPIRHMQAYVEKMLQRLKDEWPDGQCVVFGHIADGNLHLFLYPYQGAAMHDRCDEVVYGCLQEFAGSVSAEHGIGIQKKAWLGSSRSEPEIQLMAVLKRALDPGNLLNPGKVIDSR